MYFLANLDYLLITFIFILVLNQISSLSFQLIQDLERALKKILEVNISHNDRHNLKTLKRILANLLLLFGKKV